MGISLSTWTLPNLFWAAFFLAAPGGR